MLDHVGFSVSDYEGAKAFYLKALAPLGYVLVMEVGQSESDHPAAGFGMGSKPDFWIGGEGRLNRPLHVALTAKDRASVDAFYHAAIAAGGKDNGSPGPRPHYHPKLLRCVRLRSRRAQYRGRVPRAGVSACFDGCPPQDAPLHRSVST